MNTGLAEDLLSVRSEKNLSAAIKDRLSQELVIALVGPVGSGVSTAANSIQEVLTHDYEYRSFPIIKPSDIIRRESWRVGMGAIPETPLSAYISEMQTAGNRLREKLGGNYLAAKVIEKICIHRKEMGGYQEGVPIPGRRAYIVDSLKNPEELDLLRSIYKETLLVFGVFAPDAMRAQRLRDNGVPEDEIKNIMNRDRGEIPTFGQKTRKLFVEADFFLCNDRKKDELRQNVKRFIDIVFCGGIHTPTRSEWAMYEASAVSARSACMSRQVGAALVSEDGELISVGWNDVPKFGGGLYVEDDQYSMNVEKGAILDKDNRCFKWGGSVCHNETRRTGIATSIATKIAESSLVKRGTKPSDILDLVKGTDIAALIEFSRSIHAEMEAILSVAREGRRSLNRSTLYTRTYPCHNCARHIVAAGVLSVVYIEPYDKSLAVALHNDAITEDPNDNGKVFFRQYEGVAPRHYLKLFNSEKERKYNGRYKQENPKTMLPIFRVPLDSPADYEAKVITDLTEKESRTEKIDNSSA